VVGAQKRLAGTAGPASAGRGGISKGSATTEGASMADGECEGKMVLAHGAGEE
jgi:hypothetical protein